MCTALCPAEKQQTVAQTANNQKELRRSLLGITQPYLRRFGPCAGRGQNTAPVSRRTISTPRPYTTVSLSGMGGPNISGTRNIPLSSYVSRSRVVDTVFRSVMNSRAKTVLCSVLIIMWQWVSEGAQTSRTFLHFRSARLEVRNLRDCCSLCQGEKMTGCRCRHVLTEYWATCDDSVLSDTLTAYWATHLQRTYTVSWLASWLSKW